MASQSVSLIPAAVSLALSLVLTPLVRALARRSGAVARPKKDRWHKKPTAMLGGLPIAVSVLTATLAMVPCTPQMLVVLGTSAFLFFVGLVDDFWHLKPYQKLIGQVIGAAVVVYFGLTLPWTASVPLNAAITIFWLVGITNAINLLDNMDGLAAGVAAVAASFLAWNAFDAGQATNALALVIFAGALIGFLVYNANPASIFMGDCGSMFIGFFLASAALLTSTAGRSRSILPVLAVPVLTLFIPIFDTTLVMVVRTLAGRSASVGGRDHTSHRLVALGMSERRAVWMLYLFATVSGLLSLLVRNLTLDMSVAAIFVFTIALTMLGVHLAGVKVYEEREIKSARDKPLVSFLVDLSYKRRVFEVLLDLILIVLSYYVANLLYYGPITLSVHQATFLKAIPILVIAKMATFLATGVYRGLWRYLSVDSLLVFARAILLGSVASVLALVVVFRFQGFSRVIFVMDGLILFVLLTATRLAFRLLQLLLPTPKSSSDRRVLIYGAGDAGELLLRELRNNRSLNSLPVGFIDDDPLKKGRVIHGLRVLGDHNKLRAISDEHNIQEILISTARIPAQRVNEILRECAEANVAVKRLRIEIEELLGTTDAVEHPLVIHAVPESIAVGNAIVRT